MCFGDVINFIGKFHFHLGNVTAASKAALPNPTGLCGVLVFTGVPGEGYNSHNNSSTTQSYWCEWCFSVYLGMATTTTRVVLSRPTSVCGVLVFTWVRIQQHYQVLLVYVLFQCLTGYSFYNH